jgi:protein tyrosine/serine phosphatase
MRRFLASAALATLLFTLPYASHPAFAQVTGIPNFHQVNERIFRGGQPDERGWPELARLGVRTVIDLRRPGEHSTSAESIAVAAVGMRYVNVPMDGFATPTAEQLVIPLTLLDDDEPVFVHCKLGCDRTGTVIAAYRISRQGWENQRALAEAREKGLHWWENGMRRFIVAYRPAPVPDAMPASTPLADSPVSAPDSVRSELPR